MIILFCLDIPFLFFTSKSSLPELTSDLCHRLGCQRLICLTPHSNRVQSVQGTLVISPPQSFKHQVSLLAVQGLIVCWCLESRLFQRQDALGGAGFPVPGKQLLVI